MFVPELPGIEGLLAGRPGWIVALVAVQIAVTLALVGWLASRQLIVREERRTARATD